MTEQALTKKQYCFWLQLLLLSYDNIKIAQMIL